MFQRTPTWLPPDDKRKPINVHPDAARALVDLLFSHPSYQGVGYSEFIMTAVRAAIAGEWHPRPEAEHERIA